MKYFDYNYVNSEMLNKVKAVSSLYQDKTADLGDKIPEIKDVTNIQAFDILAELITPRFNEDFYVSVERGDFTVLAAVTSGGCKSLIVYETNADDDGHHQIATSYIGSRNGLQENHANIMVFMEEFWDENIPELYHSCDVSSAEWEEFIERPSNEKSLPCFPLPWETMRDAYSRPELKQKLSKASAEAFENDPLGLLDTTQLKDWLRSQFLDSRPKLKVKIQEAVKLLEEGE